MLERKGTCIPMALTMNFQASFVIQLKKRKLLIDGCFFLDCTLIRSPGIASLYLPIWKTRGKILKTCKQIFLFFGNLFSLMMLSYLYLCQQKYSPRTNNTPIITCYLLEKCLKHTHLWNQKNKSGDMEQCIFQNIWIASFSHLENSQSFSKW
jgi:hypothetical protein